MKKKEGAVVGKKRKKGKLPGPVGPKTPKTKEKMINAMQKGGIETLTEEDLDSIIKESEKIYDKLFPELDKKIQTK